MKYQCQAHSQSFANEFIFMFFMSELDSRFINCHGLTLHKHLRTFCAGLGELK